MNFGRSARAAAVLAICLGAPVDSQAQTPESTIVPTRACTTLLHLQIPGANMEITHADPVPATPAGSVAIGPVPEKLSAAILAHCRVEGIIDAHQGPDGKSYGLTFALALPDAWDGRFLFQGGGGLNGTLRAPLGAQAAGDRPALARGFAVVSTDGGHSGAVFDSSFIADQQATLDFAFNAVPTVTAVAKQLIAAYYNKPAARSYFGGCSTGGRESMQMTERYPSLFDGVLTGAPAMRTGYSNIALKWAAVAFNQVAPSDPATGKPIRGGAFSAADRSLVVKGVLEACDGLDGLKDGMIFNVRACRFDPGILICKGTKEPGCLSSAQVNALKTAFGGPVTVSGRQVYVPHPYDTGIDTQAPDSIPGFLLTSTGGPVAGGGLPLAIDVEAEANAVQANPMQQLIDTDRLTNLSTFSAHGGKQLFYHGMSDPWFSAFDTVSYYEGLTSGNGGLEKTRDFARLFLVPGMGHCQGGSATVDHFDLLTPLVDWVEHGRAPDAVSATGPAFPGRSRPLCAWPLHAQYEGHGNSDEAASFVCRP